MSNIHLDVEDDDSREQRLRQLLERTDLGQSQDPRQAAAGTSHNPSRPSFDFGERETHAVDPPTELLERVHNFLPQIEAANADLLQRAQSNPDSVDIEHLDDNYQGAHIEMNLGLGVFDVRRPASEQTDSKLYSDSVIDVDVGDSDSGDDASDSVTDGEGEDDDDADPVIDLYSRVVGSMLSTPAATQRPMKPLPKRARPDIQVLGESGPSGEPAHENTNPS